MRIGIFGGSFNPVHNGHLRAAYCLYKTAKLDLLIAIPSFIPPHKSADLCAAHDRLEMAALAFGGLAREYGLNIEISDIEIRRGGTSYTLLSVRQLELKYPGADFYLYVGSDMFVSFESWFKFEQLMEKCTIAVMARDENTQALFEQIRKLREKYKARILYLDCKPARLSSTEIREGFLDEHGCEFHAELLPREVYEYIKQKNLYKGR